MGLDINGTKFLLYAKTQGVDYSQSAMIGRQGLDLKPSQLTQNLNALEFSFNKETIDSVFRQDDGFAEEFLRCLGADCVHSFDNSKFEGATHIHDMNEKLPEEFMEKYSMVLDGGSLEHVFNFPIAIKNCMQMIRVGGHYLGITPVNNFMGHGFYQFSPELYFSIFTKINGFKLIDVIAFEDKPRSDWFEVKSPIDVRSRVTLINSQPVYLLIIAERVKSESIFESFPQQSDYISVWNNSEKPFEQSATPKAANKALNELILVAKRHYPQVLKPLIRRLLMYGFKKHFYQKKKFRTNTHNKKIPLTFVNSRR